MMESTSTALFASPTTLTPIRGDPQVLAMQSIIDERHRLADTLEKYKRDSSHSAIENMKNNKGDVLLALLTVLTDMKSLVSASDKDVINQCYALVVERHFGVILNTNTKGRKRQRTGDKKGDDDSTESSAEPKPKVESKAKPKAEKSKRKKVNKVTVTYTATARWLDAESLEPAAWRSRAKKSTKQKITNGSLEFKLSNTEGSDNVEGLLVYLMKDEKSSLDDKDVKELYVALNADKVATFPLLIDAEYCRIFLLGKGELNVCPIEAEFNPAKCKEGSTLALTFKQFFSSDADDNIELLEPDMKKFMKKCGVPVTGLSGTELRSSFETTVRSLYEKRSV